MDIRRALPADLPAVAEIYGREAREGHATFDLEARPTELWGERLTAAGRGEHFLVAADGEDVVGFAYAAPFRPKPAYAHTRETTIYLAPGSQGRGTGRVLYDDLLGLLEDDGIHLAVACIALPNPASLALHRACGFEEVGVMREVGRKFGRWIDIAWLQRILG